MAIPVIGRVMGEAARAAIAKKKALPKSSRFAVAAKAVWELLQRELRQVDALSAVLELDAPAHRIQKRSGEWIADARPNDPGVVLTIERRGKPPMQMVCRRFRAWMDNVYAIARSLEALRMVDRYGCTSSGEQYVGFAALPAPGKSARDTVQEAVDLIHEVSGDIATREGWVHQDSIAAAIRMAHPDHGGTAERLTRVLEARKTLAAAGRVHA